MSQEDNIVEIINKIGFMDDLPTTTRCHYCFIWCDNENDPNYTNAKSTILDENGILERVRFCKYMCEEKWFDENPNTIPDLNIEKIKGFYTKEDKIYCINI